MKQIILFTIDDLVANFVYYDRKEDEDLTAQQLYEAFNLGEITIDQMVERFREGLEKHFK